MNPSNRQPSQGTPSTGPAPAVPQFSPTEHRYRSEFIFHAGILLAVCAVLTMSLLMRVEATEHVYLPGLPLPLPESCYSKMMLGIDCPGCGMTRAFISISHRQLELATQFNPASVVLYLFFLIQIPWHAMQLYLIWFKSKPLIVSWSMLPLVAVMAWIIYCWVFL